MAVGRNLVHLQVAPTGASPTYLDVPGVMTWDPTINTDTEAVQADGSTYYTAYSAPEGEGDMVFIDFDPDVVAILNGGSIALTGTTPNQVRRYTQTGTYTAPSFIIADWVPNADKFHDTWAGIRTIAPNVTATPVSRASGQDTTFEWTCSTSFKADGTNRLLMYELLESDPAMTGGLMAVTL